MCDEDRENYIYKEKRRGGKSQKAERELAHRGWSGEREADKVGEGERWNSGGERERDRGGGGEREISFMRNTKCNFAT